MAKWPIPLMILLVSGCMPKAAHTILIPADKELPNTIGSISVQNGTNVNTDALAAVRYEIKDSPRVTLVKPDGDPDAVITLEKVKVQNIQRDCTKESKESSTATVKYDITFEWKMTSRGDKPYDSYKMSDFGSFERSGANCAEAKAALPDRGPDLAARHDAWGIGEGYAHRVAPHKRRLKRPYYGGGNDNMKKAKKLIKKKDNWEGAAEIWAEVAEKAGDKKIRGKAQFNLAVHYEREKKYDTAIEWLQKARKNLDNGISKRYMGKLKYRQRRAKQAAGQMAPVSGRIDAGK